MMAAGAHCVRIWHSGRRPSGDVGKGEKTLAVAEEALKAEVCSLGEPGFGVNRKGSLGEQSSMPQMKREIVEVTQPVLVEFMKGRVAD